MQIEKKYWIDMLDGDSADFRVQENAYINMQDFRFGPTSDKGFAEQLESVGSTILLPNPVLPTGTNYCIGTADDFPKRRVIYFVWNSNGNHGIFCFDFIANAVYLVLASAQVTAGLNFDKNHLIHSARVENGGVYWTDHFNEPRRIDINAGIYLNNPSLAPSTTVGINRQSAVVGAFLVNTYTFLDSDPPLIYDANLQLYLARTGTAGPNVGPTDIPIPLDWSNVAVPYYQVFLNGISSYLSALDISGVNWTAVLVAKNPDSSVIRISIKLTWDWGLGDAMFPPTTLLNINLKQYLYQPYTVPLTQAVIAWIRRQPGLPPTQTKVLETPLPGTNFIKDEALLFCFRYQYRGFEYSTLSASSTLADFNEQDPPPTENSLGIVNNALTTGGYLATNIILTPSPAPNPPIPYGAGVQMKITRAGTTGPNAVETDIAIPLDWSVYPAHGYTYVIVNGLNNYFRNLPGNGSTGTLSSGEKPQSIPQTGKWYISYRDGTNPTLNILETWDWGLGDSAFPPTTLARVTLYTSVPSATRQFNRIDVAIPFGEKIDQDVRQVDLVANYLVSGVYFIIKSWKKYIAADLAAINAHNAGVTQLTYPFYNVEAGIALSNDYAVKPYDSVPLLVQTIEMAKNRGFMGNFLIGYNSANLLTSLAATFTLTTLGAPPTTGIIGEWFQMNIRDSALFAQIYRVYVIRTTQSVFPPQPASPYYYYTTQNAAPPFPQTISTGLISLGTQLSDVAAYYLAQDNNDNTPGYVIANNDTGRQSALIPATPAVNFGVLSKAFKSNASYHLSITFLDNYGRKGGVVTNDTLLITIPNTALSNNQFVTALNWTLSNGSTQFEIPVEAYYYSINITKCLRTRFFVASIGFVIYAGTDANNNYTFNETVYSTDLAGVAIDITFLSSNGMGYVFAPGDIVNFYLAGAYYSLGVIGQSAQYIVADLFDVGQLGGSSLAQFEIYTPYKPTSDEPYYEVSQLYPITNPGTAQRQFAVTFGTIAGDVFVFSRSNNLITYTSEAMSPNPKHYQLWFTDAGRPNFVDTIGQQEKLSSVAFTNTYIAGTQNNGLSTMDALDVEDISPDFGAIMKLQLASKVQKIGTIMLAICSGYSTASLYLSENTLITNTGESIVGQSSAVIGQVHELKGEFGTLNPESVIEFRGNVYWFDVQNGKIIQYADNGMYPISNYKLSRFWKLFSDQYKSMTPDQIEALGSRPFVFATADPHHGEILFTIPTTLATPPNGFLPDYPDKEYPFDIWDGQGKTIVYKLYTDPNRWQGSYGFTAEYSFYLENNLYSFKNGELYRHNESTSPYCNYYGRQYVPGVMFLSNQQINKPKVYNNFSVEGNAQPSFVYFMALYEYLQSSDLVQDSFENKEGVFYSAILRNKLDPGFQHNFPAALIAGEKMRTTALYIWAQWDATTGLVQIKFCNVGYTLSLGQKV